MKTQFIKRVAEQFFQQATSNLPQKLQINRPHTLPILQNKNAHGMPANADKFFDKTKAPFTFSVALDGVV
uniref:hypothetical protein n=1 Tax=Pantoea sp. GbtcB22 TaxID=2824767 RepID=UPI001C2F70B4